MADVLLISKNEFDSFKQEVLSLMQKLQPNVNQSQWLRSKDVRKMLNISDSFLQTMRINGSIPAYKLGDSWFYRYDEIQKALEKGKVKGGKHE